MHWRQRRSLDWLQCSFSSTSHKQPLCESGIDDLLSLQVGFIDCSEPHPQEGEVPGVIHHGNLKVAHHDLAAGVHVLHQGVLELRVSRRAQAVFGAVTNDHCKRKETNFC